ncbi:MAG: zf-HC2 domain-containing protein [Candidatus Eisenbacteria bacterium]|nr:zf-HC2 domain-containing protein [Candidatus Eisenbacteria bacterium]
MSHDHLADEQLSARLDGVLDAADEARIDSHLAGCEECAARLESFAALDGSLLDAIDHDPGDAYFADFADRVAARIAADPKGEAALAREAAGVAGSGGAADADAPVPVAKPRATNPFAWLFTPRGLAFAGSAAVLVAAVGLGVQWYGQRGAVVSTLAGSVATEQAAPSQSSDPAPQAMSAPVTDSMASTQAAPSAVATLDASAAKDAAPGTRPDRPAVAQQAAPGTLPLSPRAELAPGASRNVARARETERRSTPAPALAPPPVATSAPAPASANVTQQEGVAMSEVGQSIESSKPKATSAPEAVPPQPPARAKVTDALTQSLRENSPLGKSLGGAPAPAAAKRDLGFRGGRAEASRMSLDAGVLTDRCGLVRDTRGTPLAAAQVRVSGAQPANTRSGADGRYCFDAAPRVGDTLIELHVGFEPVRLPITSIATLAVNMEPIGTLGDKGGMLTGFASKAAPTPDVYASQSDVVRAAVTAARAQAALAARERTAESYEKLVVLWDDVAERTSGAATYDARFRSLSALHEAHAIAPESARADRLRHAIESFVAATPRTLPERATVLRWQQELRSR